MSLGISAKGKTSQKTHTDDLVHQMKRWIEDQGDWFCQVYDLGENSHILTIEVHPGIEPAQTHVKPDGAVIFRSRTTPVGPGYHQNVVDLFDGITDQFSLEWENLSQADATGYLQHRRLDELEAAFTVWIRDFAHYVINHPMKGCVSMDLPHGIRVEAEDFVATPLGPRDHQWLKQMNENPQQHTLDFYPWWNKSKDALYYQGVALTLGWSLVPWRAPRTDAEKKVMEVFVDACNQAASRQADIDLPKKAWSQCAQWLGRSTDQLSQGDDPIGELGYRHGLIHFPLGSNWSICLAGKFAQERHKESGGWLAWDQDQRVEARIFPVKPDVPYKEILTRFNEPPVGRRMTVKHEEIGFYGVGDLGQTKDGQLVLQSEYLCQGSALVLQVISQRDDSEWALNVWESVRRAV